MTPEEKLAEQAARIAKAYGVSLGRIEFSYAFWPEEDGGPSWSVYVTVPSGDRRKTDPRHHDGGATIEEAADALIARADRYLSKK